MTLFQLFNLWTPIEAANFFIRFSLILVLSHLADLWVRKKHSSFQWAGYAQTGRPAGTVPVDCGTIPVTVIMNRNRPGSYTSQQATPLMKPAKETKDDGKILY